MSDRPASPVQSPDAEARQMATDLLQASHGVLGVLRADGQPALSRIALAPVLGQLVTLVSDLSSHTAALTQGAPVSVLMGEPGPKGDPLTHPRLTLQAKVAGADKAALKTAYLSKRPKAQLYFDFSDFRMIAFTPTEAFLNGGFGKAFQFTAKEIRALIEKRAS